jgi:hypothetical protein
LSRMITSKKYLLFPQEGEQDIGQRNDHKIKSYQYQN